MFLSLEDDPMKVFNLWYDEAKAHVVKDPNAVTLATVDQDGMPDARIVLLKDHSKDGFVFFTNYESDKGQELAAHPKACLNFYWPQTDKQIRIRGRVEKASASESDGYFKMRPRGSQVGAWASQQSRPLPDYETLQKQVEQRQAEFEGGDVPRPPHWGGWRLVPLAIEFWLAQESRLHKRVRFVRNSTHAAWEATWLNP